MTSILLHDLKGSVCVCYFFFLFTIIPIAPCSLIEIRVVCLLACDRFYTMLPRLVKTQSSDPPALVFCVTWDYETEGVSRHSWHSLSDKQYSTCKITKLLVEFFCNIVHYQCFSLYIFVLVKNIC